MTETRPTRAEISLDNLKWNFELARSLASPAKVLAIVKAEAYGHGLVRMSEEFARLGADYLGVSFLEEGITLRQAGISLPILILGGLVDEQIQSYLDYDLTLTVSSVWKARHVEQIAAQNNLKARVHLKFDTGMGRVGQSWQTALLLLEAVTKLPHLNLEGIYTHFASAESEDLTFTRTQIERFHQILNEARLIGLEFPLVHCANSGALMQLAEETRFDMIRSGLFLFGQAPTEHLIEKHPIRPVMSLKTQVVFVKKPPKGTPIGYGSTWHSPGDRWIATLPIGYGDGFPRRAGNRAEVIIRGRRCPVVGNVSMDQMTVDAGDEAWLGDEAILFGSDGEQSISLWDLCRSCGVIPYEVLSGLTSRVPRVYI